ncbi:DUF5690 family protein [Aeoliella sp. ICT_H6.2]|uniref:DUF5690 family protein n=1 Tax=Aeoliella straminimaris TaxID=2954799 RepID=A0A9X2JDX8_9BACT|nr:DUF5690 family protein [Aeoliella straminimaris]
MTIEVRDAGQRPLNGISLWLTRQSPFVFSTYCIIAAFTTYFCMYAFRKPFNAAEYSGLELWGIGYKIVLVTAQLAGYTLSKFIGIKVISEMPAARRAIAILALIGIAQVALVLFAIVPPPYNWPLLFVNGLPLGMVFGLVLSFLEGRQVTEALTAGLCASFILSSDVVKSVGRTLIVDFGVSDFSMPWLTGMIFVLPLLLGVYMLSQIPPPGEGDVEERSRRLPMNRAERWAFYRRHAFGLNGLVLIYILLTVMRSIRDDFGVEIWQDLKYEGEPAIYAWCGLAIVIGVLLINGSAILVRDNRSAFLGSFGLIAGGFVLVLFSLWGFSAQIVSPFLFMVAVGLGTYVPYVAFHTTVFERMLALFRDRGNIGYLMYLADAMGYLGAVGVYIAKYKLSRSSGYLELFTASSYWLSIAALLITTTLFVFYWRTSRQTVTSPAPANSVAESA